MPITRGQAATGTKTGTIGTFAFNDTDPAWFDCDGSAKNVADEPALFAAIGYAHGGAGAVFNLPNLNDDFIRGAHAGRPVGTREADELKAHSHDFYASDTAPYDGAPDVERLDGYKQRAYPTSVTGGAETRPRNVAMKFRIKR